MPLVEIISMTEDEELLLSKLPYVIAQPLRRSLLEKNAWTRISLLRDTFLNYLKYLALLTASEFFSSSLKDKKMLALFDDCFYESGLGKWNKFINETLKFLKEHKHAFFFSELKEYYEKVQTQSNAKRYKGEEEVRDEYGEVHYRKKDLTAIDTLINFRNHYLGHGITLNEQISSDLWKQYFPVFRALLEEMQFADQYRMYKYEHGESYLLHTPEILQVEKSPQKSTRVWIEKPNGASMDILPFYIVPAEVSIRKTEQEKLFVFESYTGKTIKFFSPEGTEKLTSGRILKKLNLLLREKQRERPYSPECFTKEVFCRRVASENEYINGVLVAEKKVIPGVYVHRNEMEIKLREWIGARASVFVIAAEAGSGKTNLLIEIQKQYNVFGLACLFIRGARMEKPSLKLQIAYLLNLNDETDLQAYSGIAGTQAAPTLILVDGLNEANNSEELWTELFEIISLFEPGCLKIVVTIRANSKGDLNRYVLPMSIDGVIYGEKKENEDGLSAYTHWLTPLNMEEMKEAWDLYGRTEKDKPKFKPQFSFDDLARFDRGLYNQINNPLILRLFLEIYHGKALPKKGDKQLNIWSDWFKKFAEPQRVFLKSLAAAVMDKGQNELLLDDALKNHTLCQELGTDLIDAPYPYLKNKGWISRYTKDLNAVLSFTVEGALLYLLGLQLLEQYPPIDGIRAAQMIDENNKIQKSALEVFLCQKALNGDLEAVTFLIDRREDYCDICIQPLLIFTKIYGTQRLTEILLANPTENDWHVLFELDKKLDDLELQILRKEFLEVLMPHNQLLSKKSLWIALKSCSVLDRTLADRYFSAIDTRSELIQEDADLLNEIGNANLHFSNFEEALSFYLKSLEIRLKDSELNQLEIAKIYRNIGKTWSWKGKYKKALFYLKKCVEIQLKNYGLEHPEIANSYHVMGSMWNRQNKPDKALNFYQKSLKIRLNKLGAEHLEVAASYDSIAWALDNKKNFDKAFEFYERSLKIRLRVLGNEDRLISSSYNNLGWVLREKKHFKESFEYYEKSLQIRNKVLSINHASKATTFFGIGRIWEDLKNYDKALEFYQKSLNIELELYGEAHVDVATTFHHIGSSWEGKNEYSKALNFFRKCLMIEINEYGEKHPNVASTYNKITSLSEKIGIISSSD